MSKQLFAKALLGLLGGAVMVVCLGATSPVGHASVAPSATATPGKTLVALPGNYGYVVNGAIRQNFASGIEITRAFYVEIPTPAYFSSSLQPTSWDPSECVFFVNRDPHPVTHVQFLFSWRSRLGIPENDDPLDVYSGYFYKGGFPTGKMIEHWPGGTTNYPITSPLCTIPNFKIGAPGNNTSVPNANTWELSVRVTRVDYENGTSWGALWYAPGTKPKAKKVNDAK